MPPVTGNGLLAMNRVLFITVPYKEFALL